VLTVENPRDVTCTGCGDTRVLSGRHARRNGGSYGRPNLCKLCRTPKPKPPTDGDRRYWLRRFTDDDILLFAWAFWKEDGDADHCHAARMTLLREDDLIAA
jgi:hypothetical protein